MMGVEYSSGKGKDTFTSSAGIIKLHDILINIIPSQNMYEKTIDQYANVVYGTVGTMSCCNNVLVSLRVNIFI